ncbi:hypothetical protein HMJ29_12515 [Hymenobacter taeanensis]|uniref:DUF6799 domain-containing protein n=1 Tax=Hymenobacter taeanensis TaxID=2735321 RepID=A0A6M6BI50_9BACT|nr:MULTISPECIES: DUF6799 domain-containing protein [Hymenobacter]QJX47719.1 hypothetical protein HMJ29_12515 [Hymenobacter taeanensis]UOQ82796.1 hypothetical protein MUN83_08555 [Hymenobacter sp. 5414T-23]
MKKLPLSWLMLLGLLAATPAIAQTTTAPKMPAGAKEASSADRFMLQGGQVVLVQGKRPTPLTKNIVLSNGTKINYKSGIVELPGGKITTLKEGDYVRMDGGIVFATPSSAAAARNEPASTSSPQFQQYIDNRPAPNSAAGVELRLTELNQRISLMGEKIQLLNQKISLMSSAGQRPADTSQLDQQIKALDEKLK